MTIKFLERLLKKGGDTASEERQAYSLDRLENLLHRRRQDAEKEISDAARPVIGEIGACIREIKDTAAEIEEKDIPEDVSERIAKIIAASKPAFVQNVAESFREVEEGKADDPVLYALKIDEALSALLKAMTSHGRYLPVAYGEEFEAIRKASKNIYEKKKELEKFRGSKEQDNMQEKIGKIREHLSFASLLEKDAQSLSAIILLLDAENKRLKLVHDSIEETEGFKELSDNRKALEEIVGRREEIENIAYNALTPLRRPLRIYSKNAEDLGQADAKDLSDLERYAENPGTALAGGKDIKNLLESLEAHLEKSGEDAKEREKIHARIVAAKNSGLAVLIPEYASLAVRGEEMQKLIDASPVLAEKCALGRSIEKKAREGAEKQEELSKIRHKQGEIEKETRKLVEELEKDAALVVGRKIDIRLN